MLKNIIKAIKTKKPVPAKPPVMPVKPPVATVPTPALSFELSTAELVDLCLVAASFGVGYKDALSKLISDAKASLADPASNATSRLIAKMYGGK